MIATFPHNSILSPLFIQDRYYKDKCKAEDVAENGGREHLFRSYVMGLCWVMKYYYQGCPSWKWYFPFHYAPFASDLKNIERFSEDCKNFELNEPFSPIEQLMAVLPEDSSHAIPKLSRWLMSDPESPIIDFYPKEILCDPNGKAMPWLWVVLLPFIDEQRLLDAMDQSKWTEYEKLCNARGLDDGYVFCHITHPLASALTPALDLKEGAQKLPIQGCEISGEVRKPLSNEIYPLDEVSVIEPPTSAKQISSASCDDLLSSPIDPNAAICTAFTEPKQGIHKSVLLYGVKLATPVLSGDDLRIRRPRLNRQSKTIANMGGSTRQGQSYQTGYGSMNINSYERDLAHRQGRGHEMNQTGTRAWGAMEPSRKKQRHGNHNQFQQQQQYQPTLFQPSNAAQNRQSNGHQSYSYQQGGYQQQRSHQNRWQPPPPPPPRHNVVQQPAQHTWQQQQGQGYSFEGYVQSQQQQQYGGNGGAGAQPSTAAAQQQAKKKTKSGVDQSMMNSLRAQLKGTLNNNRNRGNGK